MPNTSGTPVGWQDSVWLGRIQTYAISGAWTSVSLCLGLDLPSG